MEKLDDKKFDSVAGGLVVNRGDTFPLHEGWMSADGRAVSPEDYAMFSEDQKKKYKLVEDLDGKPYVVFSPLTSKLVAAFDTKEEAEKFNKQVGFSAYES